MTTFTSHQPVSPTDTDRALARESSRTLGPRANDALRLRIEGTDEVVQLPALAVRLLMNVLTTMANGDAVTLIPVHAELTTQQAADLLGVSRPFVIEQITAGRLPHRKVGTHRRIAFLDLMAYKQRMDAERRKALQALADQAQELDLGY